MRKSSLREFQNALSKRLASAATQSSAPLRLTVEAGGEHWVLDLLDAGEVLPLPALTPVPLARPYYAGVANVRGSLYSVVDFALLCGKAATARGADARLMLCGRRFGLNAGLLFERIAGLRNAADFRIAAATAAPLDWSGHEYADSTGARYRELRMEALVPHSDFMNLAAS